jgi:L-fuconolactonase
LIIDAYSHCGKSKFLPVEELLAAMRQSGVDRAMLCQHLGEYDNTYLESVVKKYPGCFMATCLIDPSRPDAVDYLRRLHASGCFRGIRVVSETVEQHFELCAEAVSRGMNIVLYAPEGMEGVVESVRRLARSGSSVSSGRIVISHLGNPRVVGDQLVAGKALLELASEQNIDVLLSGLSMFCPYPYLPLYEFIREVVAAFSAGRVLWGSNFPVCGGQEEYRRDLHLVRSNAFGLKESEIDQITGGTADGVWFRRETNNS